MELMDEAEISARRAALHCWIDHAPAEHIARIDREVQSISGGDTAEWPREEPLTERLAPEAQIKAMMAQKQNPPSSKKNNPTRVPQVVYWRCL